MTYVEMRVDLTPQIVTLPPDVTVQHVSAVPQAALYACYDEAFRDGDAAFFFEQSEAERREFFDELVSTDAASLVLLRGREIVGFCYVLPFNPPNCHMSCMCVRLSDRRQGMGTALVRLSMNAALQAGYTSMSLGTDLEMAAFRLYQRHGFQVIPYED